MADSLIQLPSDGSGKKLGTKTWTQGADTVHGQDIVLVDSSGNVISVLNSAPAGTEYALVTRPIPSGTQTVSGTVTANAGTGTLATDPVDDATREVGRVRLWDGTDEATITALRAAPASTDKALVTREVPNRLATFSVATTTIQPAISIGVKEALALWHANTQTKDIYIVEIWATVVVSTASTTGGRTAIRVSTISTAPTGGSAITPVDPQTGTSDMTNAMQVKTGGGTIGTTFIRKLAEFATQPLGRLDIPIFNASNPGNGLILPQGTSAGISIDIEREAAHTALVDNWTVGARWLEI